MISLRKRINILNELHRSVDMNKLCFEYVGNTKAVNFYEYIDSKKLFDRLKNNQIRFDDAKKKQEELLNKINEVKIGKKNARTKRSNYQS